MSQPAVKSLIDEQLAEVAGIDPADVIKRAERLGFIGWPIKSYREPQGPWVHRYSKDQRSANS
ncbi:Uncharacterized protein ALO80_04058 [Pseudomonas caricapapayae]|uniref:Uncharacterized protein n=1 Tax=Pseudomonas caricapapayae TaxID=46678 RepID=A0A0P9KSE6_9PSED|nr:hypothetical protein [Pseudomonas caricapapayae]KAA8689604.1 hypothetical protein F4W67_27660 [Pseudomonas caricapapayae]KPW59235.1 Uncharacterized protein ALO80_04058 [Pseudomonas caricapapayae]RMM09283.1 hypothetical protein ALQ84_03088 [Pseudomonas caricapapayae]